MLNPEGRNIARREVEDNIFVPKHSQHKLCLLYEETNEKARKDLKTNRIVFSA